MSSSSIAAICLLRIMDLHRGMRAVGVEGRHDLRSIWCVPAWWVSSNPRFRCCPLVDRLTVVDDLKGLDMK